MVPSTEPQGLVLRPLPLMERFPEVLAVMSHRTGGVSGGIYRSLNLGFSTGDEPACVRENRWRLYRACGIDAERVVVGAQVHGAGVVEIREEDAGRGALDIRGVVPEADGMVTRSPAIYLLAISADCPVIVLYAPSSRTVATAHCGWRGAARGMVESALDAVCRAGGGPPAGVWAAVSPSIGSCCMEVREDVADRFRHAGFLRPGPPGSGRYYLDLKGFIRERLLSRGVPAAQVAIDPECTSCRADRFFSHRKERGRTGRGGVLAGIRPPSVI